MSKRVIRCQVWEWYGSCIPELIGHPSEGRYKAKGGEEFVFDATPETDSMSEEELIDKWNEKYDQDGRSFKYEARSVDYYWEPRSCVFEGGSFHISNK